MVGASIAGRCRSTKFDAFASIEDEDYMTNTGNDTLSFFGEGGEKLLSRDTENSDRGEEQHVEDLAMDILMDGLAMGTAGDPIIIPDKDRPNHYFLLTCGHRVEAVYRAHEREPTNAKVLRSIATGLRHSIILHVDTPTPVKRWLAQFANKFAKLAQGYTIVEFFGDVLRANAALQVWLER